MIDIKLVRENPDLVRENVKKKFSSFDVEALILKDKQWRESLQQLEQLNKERNIVTKEIATQRDDSKIAHMKEVKEKIKAAEEGTVKLEAEVKALLMKCPNILHPSVPVGKDESENPEVRRWGKAEKKPFEVKNHAELVEAMHTANFEKAASVTGRGFNYLVGDMVLLDMALQRFAIDHLIKKGYVPIYPPFMLNRKAYEGVVDLGDFENVMYKIENEDLYMIATSEHPLMAFYSNEVLPEESLPFKNIGISTCFRKEIGAHTVDTRGLYRMHQFNKIEQTIVCKPEDSYKLLEEIVHNAEEIFQALGIPHRVIEICSGDLSIVKAKSYDIEAWYPRQGKFGEVVSGTNCTDYQARRLGIKFGKYGGEKELAHTLNCTAIATSRAMVAVLENYQNADGSITVPEVLRSYMYGKTVIGKA